MNALTKIPDPASPQELAGEVVKMFAAYASFYQPPEQFKLTVAAYVEKLSAYPLTVVSRARERLSDQPRSKPANAGEFKAECEAVQYPFGRPRTPKLPEPARQISDDVVARVAAGMKAFAKELAAGAESAEIRRRADDRTPEDIRKEAAKRLDELHAQRHQPITLSQEALTIIGARNPPQTLDDLERDVLR